MVEHVESTAALRRCVEIGVAAVQGFLLGRPVPAEELLASARPQVATVTVHTDTTPTA